MSNMVGLEGRVYVNSNDASDPNWVLVDDVKNVTLGAGKTLADMTTRSSNKTRMKKAAIKEIAPEIELLWDNESATHGTFRAAYFADTIVDVLILDGPLATVGSTGFRAQYEVASFTRGEQLEEGMTINVKLEISVKATHIGWYVVE